MKKFKLKVLLKPPVSSQPARILRMHAPNMVPSALHTNLKTLALISHPPPVEYFASSP